MQFSSDKNVINAEIAWYDNREVPTCKYVSAIPFKFIYLHNLFDSLFLFFTAAFITNTSKSKEKT